MAGAAEAMIRMVETAEYTAKNQQGSTMLTLEAFLATGGVTARPRKGKAVRFPEPQEAEIFIGVGSSTDGKEAAVESEEKRAAERVQCATCGKAFKTEWALECHLYSLDDLDGHPRYDQEAFEKKYPRMKSNRKKARASDKQEC